MLNSFKVLGKYKLINPYDLKILYLDRKFPNRMVCVAQTMLSVFKR